MNSPQLKSKKRVTDHGEVFTNEREVSAMLDLVKNETERIEARFLEPACGNGNFLAEVLARKLAVVTKRYHKSQSEWEFYAVIAVSSIYGVDILEDNAQECRQRLSTIFEQAYTSLFKENIKIECRESVRFLLHKNILWGDALDFTNPLTKSPIIFAEWTPLGSSHLKRKDYVFQFLVQGSFQTTLFDENNTEKYFDKEVANFPSTHYLKLAELL